MHTYSAVSQQLAQKLAEKAATNLRKSGHTVTRNVITGRYVIKRKPHKP